MDFISLSRPRLGGQARRLIIASFVDSVGTGLCTESVTHGDDVGRLATFDQGLAQLHTDVAHLVPTG